MLYINKGKINAGEWKVWHIGEPMPKVEGRILTIQADGDELDIIWDAIRKASKVSELEKAKEVATRGFSYGDLVGICMDKGFESIGEAIDYAYKLPHSPR